MNKLTFLAQLRKGLSGLPQEDIEERLAFYGEMIEDRMEEGLSEEDAVSQVGTVDEIVTQIVAETPLAKIAKERMRPKRKRSAGETALLVIGSPLWLSLGIAAAAVIFALYLSLWAVIVALWAAVFGSLAACAVGCLLAGIAFLAGGHAASGVATLAAGLVCAGLAIVAFYGCHAATRGTVVLTEKIALWIKNCFKGREEA